MGLSCLLQHRLFCPLDSLRILSRLFARSPRSIPRTTRDRSHHYLLYTFPISAVYCCVHRLSYHRYSFPRFLHIPRYRMERLAIFIKSYDHTSFKRENSPLFPPSYSNTQCGSYHFPTPTSQACKTAILPASTHRNNSLHWILPHIAYPC